MDIRKAKPLSDRVLVEKLETEKIGSLYVPDTAKNTLGQIAKVLICGPGKFSEHTLELMPMDVRPGDTVVIGKYTGWRLEGEDKNLRMIHNSDILALVE